jgi:hypothetical protein
MDVNDRDGSWREGQVFELMDGAVRVWLEQEVIHLVAFDKPYHDPVELTESMARELADTLRRMAERLDV